MTSINALNVKMVSISKMSSTVYNLKTNIVLEEQLMDNALIVLEAMS